MLDPIRHIDPSSIKDIDSSRDTVKLLLNIVEQQSEQLEQFRQENQELKDEINRLKGEQGRPKFPKAKEPAAKDVSSEKKRRKKARKKGKKKPNIDIDRTEYRQVDKSTLPADAQFKGYDDVIQQELCLIRRNTLYKVERYYSPSQGKLYRGQLPEEYIGEFGAGLQSLVQMLHHVCDVTHGRLDVFLKSQGILMSAGTISNILLSGQSWACEEQREILRAGIEASPYTQADSTKSKEKGQAKTTQVIGSAFFTVFYTMDSKSRLDVLRALLGMPPEGLSLCLNATSRQLLSHFGVSKKDRRFLDKHLGDGRLWDIPAFSAYLQEHAPQIRAKKNMYPRILESLALGYYHEQVDFPVVKSLLSDDAPEYLKIALWFHALCWIHDARHYNKLAPKIELHRSIKEEFQNKYWQFYYQLLDFKELPAPQQEAQKLILKQQFESLFKPSTDYFQLNECIRRTLENKEKLLAALDNPALPLHNNGMELGARRVVRKRDISLHSWSKTGTKVRDAFMSIVETAAKLGVNAMDYIADRVTQKYQMTHLAALVRQAYD
jgi:hypothetical protein